MIDPKHVSVHKEELVAHQQHMGKSLVVAMKMALAAGNPSAAELVACECVVLAETKDHADWELIGECAKAADGETAAALIGAYEQVEDEVREYLQAFRFRATAAEHEAMAKFRELDAALRAGTTPEQLKMR